MPRLRILISGAGIAGIALAFWLSKLGHEITVIERFPGLRVTGLQLDLRGHGIEVLKRMGLEAAFRSNSAPEPGIQIVDTDGRRWGYLPANKGSQTFTSDFEIMRGDLCRIMYDVTKDKVKYIFGASIESHEETENSPVEVRFTNGTKGQFDLLAGADGQSSRTRKMMFSSESSNGLQSLDESVACLRIPRRIQEGEEYIATAYMAPGGRFVLTRRHSPKHL
ncbi:Fc.00g029810.m01.CDS01 [Cosmosporella sp. VM-42]